jgi:response regulator of citrate/malate metabolism
MTATDLAELHGCSLRTAQRRLAALCAAHGRTDVARRGTRGRPPRSVPAELVAARVGLSVEELTG